jgi:hypothetical protein
LLEAMGYGNCVLTLATPENIEVVGKPAFRMSTNMICEKLRRVLRDGSLVQAYRNRAQQRVQTVRLGTVVDQYEQLFASMSGSTFRKHPPVADERHLTQTSGNNTHGCAS